MAFNLKIAEFQEEDVYLDRTDYNSFETISLNSTPTHQRRSSSDSQDPNFSSDKLDSSDQLNEALIKDLSYSPYGNNTTTRCDCFKVWFQLFSRPKK